MGTLYLLGVALAISTITVVALTTRLILVTTSEPKPRNMIQLPVIRHDNTGADLHTFINLPSAGAHNGCKGLAVTSRAILIAIFGAKFLEPSPSLLIRKLDLALQGAGCGKIPDRAKSEATILPVTKVAPQNDQSGQEAQADPMKVIQPYLGDLSQADQAVVLGYLADRPRLVEAIMSDKLLVKLIVSHAKNGQVNIHATIRYVV